MDEREAGSRYFLTIPPNGSESGNYHSCIGREGVALIPAWKAGEKVPISAFFSNQRMPEKNLRYWYIREYWM